MSRWWMSGAGIGATRIVKTPVTHSPGPRQEVQTFSNYLSSAVYGFVIEKDGNEIDSCWDFAGDQGGHCLEGDRSSIPAMATNAAAEGSAS